MSGHDGVMQKAIRCKSQSIKAKKKLTKHYDKVLTEAIN